MPMHWLLAVVAAVALVPVPAAGHHSFAAQFDVEKPVMLHGVISRVEWQNPHIWIYLDVTEPDRGTVTWQCEGDNPNMLARLGWSKEAFEIGAAISIRGYQAHSGGPICNGRTWTVGDRTMHSLGADGGPRSAPAETR